MGKSLLKHFVKAAIHIEGGLMDHADFKCVGDERKATVEVCSNYFNDHDMGSVFIP